MINFDSSAIARDIGEICKRAWEEITKKPSINTTDDEGRKITTLTLDGYLGEIWTDTEVNKVHATVSFSPEWSDVHVNLLKFEDTFTDDRNHLEVYQQLLTTVSERMMSLIRYKLFHFNTHVTDIIVERKLKMQTAGLLNKLQSVFSHSSISPTFCPIIIDLTDDTVRVITKLPDGTIYDEKTFHDKGECLGVQAMLEAIVFHYQVDYKRLFSKIFKLFGIVPVRPSEKNLTELDKKTTTWRVEGQGNTEHEVTFKMAEDRFVVVYQVTDDEGDIHSTTFEENFNPEHPFTIYEAFDNLCKGFWFTTFLRHLEGHFEFDKLGEKLKELTGGDEVELVHGRTPLYGVPKWRYQVKGTHAYVFVNLSVEPEYYEVYLDTNENGERDFWLYHEVRKDGFEEVFNKLKNFIDTKQVEAFFEDMDIEITTPLWYAPLWLAEGMVCDLRLEQHIYRARLTFSGRNHEPFFGFTILLELNKTLSENLKDFFEQYPKTKIGIGFKLLEAIAEE